jgi:hypothetical protein
LTVKHLAPRIPVSQPNNKENTSSTFATGFTAMRL